MKVDVTRNAAFREIAGQKVKSPGHAMKGNGQHGTVVPPSFGATQGMKSRDFETFKQIAGQKVVRGAQGRVRPAVPASNKSHAGARNAGNAGIPEKVFDAVREIADRPVKGRTPRQPDKSEDREAERKEEDARLLETAKKRFDLAAESEASVRRDALEDLRFFSGDQWEDGIKRQRQMDGRPCLTINRLPQFVRQVTNEQRQNRPSIQVNPVDEGADVETAQILQGLVRHIEYDSGADAAYDTAFFGAASCGFGYFRVTTEYSDAMSFDQEVRIARIRNPFTVYYDPNAKEADYSDAEWAFVVETMSRDAYRRSYPESELSGMEDWQSIGDTGTGWVDREACRVAEYFWRETEMAKLVQLSDGTSALEEELPETLPAGIEVVAKRETAVSRVRWAKLNGMEVLEQTEWAGKWIPIVKVVGDELDIDGKLMLKGIVRDAKEPQRQFNYMKSASTEAIALAPKAPFVGAEGQFEGYERQWQQANVKNQAYLQYKPVAIGGQPVPPPQRNVAEPAIQAINVALMESADDLKAVTGIYDASLGAQGNETSGKAILARQQQAQGANFHYLDNLTRAIRHCGRILLDLIPKIYDTPRMVRIIGDEGEQKTVMIGGSQAEAQAQGTGYDRIYDLGLGKYDVTISTGPSYQSRRQEAVSSIIDLTRSYPMLMGVAGDILVKNMDWPGAREIAERLKKMLPPQLQPDAQNQELPPQVQQAMAQQMEMIQKLTQELQATKTDLEKNVSVKKMETESRERIAAGEQRLRELEIAGRAG